MEPAPPASGAGNGTAVLIRAPQATTGLTSCAPPPRGPSHLHVPSVY